MRTRQCRKLVDIDPICLDVRAIKVTLAEIDDPSTNFAPFVSQIQIDDTWLYDGQIEAFAVADGFDPQGLSDGLASRRMAHFWARHHGMEDFYGVVIRWEPSNHAG